jgi:lipopolysaccharide export system protein LptA
VTPLKFAGILIPCLLYLASLSAASNPSHSSGNEETFWKDMARPSNVTSPTTFKGDYMEYVSSGSVLFLKRSASITDSSSTLTADEITVTLNEKRTHALGRAHLVMPTDNKVQPSTVSITSDEMTIFGGEKRAVATGRAQTLEDGRLIRGSRIDFNWKLSTGTVDDASGFEPPWRFSGRRMIQTGPRTYNLTNAMYTSCDLEHPHYFFKSSFAQMVRGKRITGVDNFLHVDGLPVFWTAIFNHLLSQQALVLQVKPGETKRDGTTIKSNLYYGFAKGGYVRGIMDYYYKTGIGQGLEVGYSSPKVLGTIYTYHVDDHNPDLLQPTDLPGTSYDKERWKGYMAHWQKLSPRLTMQANVNYLSDQNFNNLFIPERFEPIVNPAIGTVSSLAFTHRLPWASTTISSVRTDTFDTANNNKFFNKDWTLPSLAFQTIPLKSKYLPFLTQINASYINDIQTENSIVTTSTSTQSGSTQVTLSKGITLNRSMTLTPQLGIQESLTKTDPPISQNPSGILLNRNSENTNLHDRLAPRGWLDMDLSHSITMRSVQNKFVQDANALDHGIEAHAFNLTLFSAPNPGTWMRVTSGYNLRVVDKNGILNGTSGDYAGPPEKTFMGSLQQRTNSPNFEFNIKPRKDIEFYIRELYHVFPALHNGVTQFRTTWQPNLKTYYQGSIAYNNGSPGQLQLTTTAGFNVTPEWRIQTDLGYIVSGAGGLQYDTIAPSYRELKIIRTIHCWQFNIHVIDRPGVRQILFGVQLMSDILAERNVSTMEQQEQLYPWRQPWKE